MKLKSLILAALIFGLPQLAYGETIETLLARLVAEDTIEAYGLFAQIGNATTITDNTGSRDMSEWIVSNVMVRTPRGQRKTEIVLSVYDRGQDDEEAYLSEGDENREPEKPTKKEQIARGRAAIISMITNVVPVPAAPSAALPVQITEPAWAGQTITEYKWPKDDDVDEGEIFAARVWLYLSTDGKTKVRISVDDVTNNFIIEPVDVE